MTSKCWETIWRDSLLPIDTFRRRASRHLPWDELGGPPKLASGGAHRQEPKSYRESYFRLTPDFSIHTLLYLDIGRFRQCLHVRPKRHQSPVFVNAVAECPSGLRLVAQATGLLEPVTQGCLPILASRPAHPHHVARLLEDPKAV